MLRKLLLMVLPLLAASIRLHSATTTPSLSQTGPIQFLGSRVVSLYLKTDPVFTFTDSMITKDFITATFPDGN